MCVHHDHVYNISLGFTRPEGRTEKNSGVSWYELESGLPAERKPQGVCQLPTSGPSLVDWCIEAKPNQMLQSVTLSLRALQALS